MKEKLRSHHDGGGDGGVNAIMKLPAEKKLPSSLRFVKYGHDYGTIRAFHSRSLPISNRTVCVSLYCVRICNKKHDIKVAHKREHAHWSSIKPFLFMALYNNNDDARRWWWRRRLEIPPLSSAQSLSVDS
jgi:hypothetical protein